MRASTRDLKLWESLREIQDVLGSTEGELASLLGLSRSSYRRYRASGRSLPVESVFQLTDRLPIGFEKLMTGEIDFEALHEHSNGNLDYLPARYRDGDFSKRRTSVNALYFIENHLGPTAKKNLLKHFQVSAEAFRDPDRTINIHFITDVLNYLQRYGHQKESFVQIGRYSTDTNLRSHLAEVYAECRTPGEMYDKLINALIANYDENFQYRLTKLTSRNAVIRVYQKPETEAALKLKRYGCEPICWMRVGLTAALPRYNGLPEAVVNKTKCVFNGDECCEMEIDYEFAYFAAVRRPFSSHSHH
jgi:predicted hydrocarbon binding protein